MWYANFGGGGFSFFLGGFLFNLEGSGGGTQAFVFCFFILGGGATFVLFLAFGGGGRGTEGFALSFFAFGGGDGGTQAPRAST